MNLQNHKQQEINFNKETNPSSQKQQKVNPSSQNQSQMKLDSKSTASSFKNQSSSNSWRKLVLESQKSISHLRPFCARFFRTNETNVFYRPSQNVLIEKSFLNQNQSLENRQENREKQTQSKLTSLSDSNLLSQTKLLVQKERKITVEVLEHLCEIDQRKLYLKRGFSSLFEYTTKELGYSEGSTYRRINAMKLCREFPETAFKIQNGNLNLTTASQLQSFFEKQNKNQSKLRRSDSSSRRNCALKSEDQKQLSLKDQKKPDLENQNQYLESQNQPELRRDDSSPRRNVASILPDQNQSSLEEQKQLSLKDQKKSDLENQNQSDLRRSDSSPRRNVASILPDQNQSSLEDQKQLSLKDQKKSDLENQNQYLESQNQSDLRRQ